MVHGLKSNSCCTARSRSISSFSVLVIVYLATVCNDGFPFFLTNLMLMTYVCSHAVIDKHLYMASLLIS